MAANSPACEKDAEALQLMEKMTRDADLLQRNVLAQILAQNGQTEYLRGFSTVDGVMDRETFKSVVPMASYEDLQPLIRRIADGDCSPVLCGQPISEFIFSSGTSMGEPKLIPSINGDSNRILLFSSFIMPVLHRFVKGLDKGKTLSFMFNRPETKTKGGIVSRASLTSLFKNDIIKNQTHGICTSSYEASCCGDTFQSMYAQMLCGLYEREQVLQMGASFASGLIRAIRFLQLNWKQLAHDIRNGSLDPKVITDTPLRECMARVMRPDPNLADFISQECAEDNWEGIITRIWPNTKILCTVVTGSMAQYIPTLDYYSGGLPIASMCYASSECYFGINLNPMCKPSEVSYTFMPFMAYFEFLPYQPEAELDHSQLVDLVDVEIGKEYELVITTFAGLYRYRVGDIVRVAGFHNSAPQFQFVRRKHVLLNLDWEKTTEIQLQMAVENAAKLLEHTHVVDYTSFADTTTMPGHYVIYWELQAINKDQLGNSPSHISNDVLEQCCLVMEESLNSIYRMFRVSDKSVGPLEIRVVKNGTFEELMDDAVSRGASVSQYKVPRCVSSKPIVDLLNSRVVSTHFCQSLPHWTSEIPQ